MSTVASPTATAEEAVRLAPEQPARARALAEEVLGASSGTDAEAEAVAEWAIGLAARAANDVRGAEVHLRRSLDVALAAGLRTRAAQARTSLALVLAYSGRTAEALGEADLAAGVLGGADAGRLQSQRALILQRLGRLDEALEGYRRALAVLRRAGDSEAEARVLTNRGVLHAYRGEFRAAESDLRRAERLHARLGLVLQAAEARHNLGFVAARRGDVPAALAWYDSADRELSRLGSPRAALLLDRCETLLAARLLPEAREAGEAAVVELETTGMHFDLAEAHLLLAQVAVLAGDSSGAADLAARARRSFVAQGRRGWSALARYAGLQASAGAAAPSEAQLAEAHATVADLERSEWALPTLDARVMAARIALALGRADEAAALLREASAARRRGPARLRAKAWHAEALLRRARGDGRGADAAARAGLCVLARHAASVGGTELRVHAGAEGLALAALGLAGALESGRPERVLRWSERARAWGSRVRQVHPPADATLAEDLAELRHVAARIEDCGFAAETAGPLLRRQAAIEERVRRKAWRAAGGPGESGTVRPPSVGELASALGDAALVEILECAGDLHAVTVAGGRARLRHLGPVGPVRAELAGLRFALDRVAGPARSVASHAAARSALDHAGRRLDDLLMAPVAPDVGDRPLVIIPTGALHALAWAALPSCRARSVTVSPSATLWIRTGGRAATTLGRGAVVAGAAPGRAVPLAGAAPGRAVLVAGPALRHAAAEVHDVAACHPHATTFEGRDATAARVVRSLDGAEVAHVAAHGSFRADNPLFSSLRLADGPLTVYDLEALASPPRRLVLSACDSGLSAVGAGNELLGLTSTLLALGAETVVASVAMVPDVLTRPLMVELHRRLVSGTTPASALAEARAAVDGTREASPTAGFVCFGRG